MAKLEIELAPDEQAQLQQQAQQTGLSLNDWARRRLLNSPAMDMLEKGAGVFVTTDDGEVIELPGPPAASEHTTVPLRPFGLCAGEFTAPDDFDAPMELVTAATGEEDHERNAHTG